MEIPGARKVSSLKFSLKERCKMKDRRSNVLWNQTDKYLTNQSLNINLEVPALEVRISPILVQNYLRNTFFNQLIVLRSTEETK